MIAAKQGLDTCSNPLGQRIVAGFLASGRMQQHIAGLAAAPIASGAMPCWRHFRGISAACRARAGRGPMAASSSGSSCPAPFPPTRLFALALEEGVAFIPGSAFLSRRWAPATPCGYALPIRAPRKSRKAWPSASRRRSADDIEGGRIVSAPGLVSKAVTAPLPAAAMSACSTNRRARRSSPATGRAPALPGRPMSGRSKSLPAGRQSQYRPPIALSDLRAGRARRASHRSRRPSLSRSDRQLHLHDPGPFAARGGRRSPGPGCPRHRLGRGFAGRSGAGRNDPRAPGLCRWPGALHRLGHRSHVDGDPRGPRLHRPSADREVRGRLSRAERLRHGEPRPCTGRGWPGGRAEQRAGTGRARRPSPIRSSCCLSTMPARWKRSCASAARTSPA